MEYSFSEHESVQEMNICKDKRLHGRPFGNEALSKHQRSRLKLMLRILACTSINTLLKAYKAKLVVFPRHAGKFKNYSGEAACEF
ncbi:hypothetical protein MKW92_038849 [Papaver armeniacum]|nr:hypothetical protein MKW92_038849 [Papaver armeniacum]